MGLVPKIPVGVWVDVVIEWAQVHLDWLFSFIFTISNAMIAALRALLLLPHPLLFIALVVVVVALTGHRRLAIGAGIGLFLVLNLGLWELSMITLALILAATAFALLLGVPFGIVTAWSNRLHGAVMPVLDFMQTMPPFVYLVPAVVLLSAIGEVPALIAIVIFAMPPVIRLTGLGIRQVPADLVEAARAFGSTKLQTLAKVQLPLAMPTIMAGVNQCIMLALSMAVIAAMIGAGGLGGTVLRGLQRLDVPIAFEGGLGIVIIAIILDRITQKVTGGRDGESPA